MVEPLSPDDLARPLGIERPGETDRRDIPYGRIALAGVGVLAGSLAVFAYVTAERTGSEPRAIAPIAAAESITPPTPATAASAPAPPPSLPPAPARADILSAAALEGASGVKIVRAGKASSPNALIIEVPQPAGIRLAPAPDPRLAAPFGDGVLPRIGKDGSRPADVYARPLVLPTGLPPDAPRIAIIVGGVGLGHATTVEAIQSLPGEVSLAFAPYGPDLAADTANARTEGHEIMLQAPMEPFDYPRNNPGPATLLSSLDEARNLERLHWLMSRFSGYVGIINFLGAKFMADRTSLSPILRDIAQRGLIYADDGTSAQTVAAAIAGELGLPMVRTDILIDATPTVAAIDHALADLEAEARQKGIAVGSASALPVTLDCIARWSAHLADRGIALIPASAAARRLSSLAADGR